MLIYTAELSMYTAWCGLVPVTYLSISEKCERKKFLQIICLKDKESYCVQTKRE